MWQITDRGFLDPQDPLRSLTAKNPEFVPLVARLENIPAAMPYWIEDRKVREELVCTLREAQTPNDHQFFMRLDDREAERAMHLYSYMASAYVFARHEAPATRIPVEIAVPLSSIARRIGRQPILSYASYCLTNWERIDPNGPIELGNIRLLTNFCAPSVGKSDEDWFILVHVDIENAAAGGVAACKSLLEKAPATDPAYANDVLTNIFVSLGKMNRTLARMPEECNPDNYFRWVRPYIFSFKDIEFEGCYNNPYNCRGETGAQSSIIPAFLAALEIKHKDSMLTHHLQEMRDYMPQPHRQFLENLVIQTTKYTVEGTGLRAAAQASPALKEIYNECVNEIIKFRNKHFEYAVNYIQKKVDNPSGTGGTPYVPWLKQLREETEEHLLP